MAEAIAAKHAIGLRELLSHDRHRIYSWPRQELFYHAVEMVGCWKGAFILGWHHSTIIHGARRHAARMAGQKPIVVA